MAKINLLPWRAERRQQRQKEFYMMLLGAAIVAVVISFGVIQYFGWRIEDQQRQNTFLQDEIKKLDAAIAEIEALDRKKAELLARKAVIEQLQANRSQMVHLFDELVRTIPDGVRLNTIKQEGDVLTLDGVAQSNARVSSYIRALEASGWIANPDLTVIEAKDDNKALPFRFALKVKLVKPKSADEQDEVVDGVAQAGGGQ